MYLFFDTETTGLPLRRDAPVSDLANWPRLVQLAWATFDKRGKRQKAQTFLIKPDGFRIPSKAARIHRITTRRARKDGVALTDALRRFALEARASKVFVAHNLVFDERVVHAEFLRAKMTAPFSSIRRVCTMQSSVDLCALPGPYDYKRPSLSELTEALFDEPFKSSHEGLSDIDACARCFFELRRRGIIRA